MSKMSKLLTISLLFGGLGLVAIEENRQKVKQLSDRIINGDIPGYRSEKSILGEYNTEISPETQDLFNQNVEEAVKLFDKLEICRGRLFQSFCRNKAASDYMQALSLKDPYCSHSQLNHQQNKAVNSHANRLRDGVKELASK